MSSKFISPDNDKFISHSARAGSGKFIDPAAHEMQDGDLDAVTGGVSVTPAAAGKAKFAAGDTVTYMGRTATVKQVRTDWSLGEGKAVYRYDIVVAFKGREPIECTVAENQLS